MGLHLEWSIEGEKQLSRVLMDIKGDTERLFGAFNHAAGNLRTEFEKEVFDSKGASIDETWKRLSPATLARKARSGFPAHPLIATGAMRRSFRHAATNEYGVVFNTADYFKYHQSNRPRKKLPRRVMMKLGNNQREMVIKVFQQHIFKSVKKS